MGPRVLKNSWRHSVPRIVAFTYASMVLCLFFFVLVEMLTGRDEFGYSAIPALYAPQSAESLSDKQLDVGHDGWRRSEFCAPIRASMDSHKPNFSST